jgi:putative inorganic carbon (HCO3(-)) transporter
LKPGRVAVAGTPALAAVVFWRPLNDAFALPKATVVVLGALVAMAAGGAALWRGSSTVREPRFLALLAGFGALVVVATVFAHQPAHALVGDRMRHAGAGLYLAGAVLAAAGPQVFRRASARWVLWGLLGAAAVVAVYAVLQDRGIDPFDVAVTAEPLVATMGNTNFVSGWLGVAFPVAVWAMLSRGQASEVALLGAATAATSLVALVALGSFQGWVAGVAGAALVLGVWLHQRGWFRRAAVVAAVVGVVVVAVAGPTLWREVDDGLTDRPLFWSAGVVDLGDRPLVGHGLDTFAHRWYALRARTDPPCQLHSGIDVNAGATHDIPLDLAVGGGVPLLLAYLGMVGFVGWRLVRGLRACGGEERLVLAGLGGAWLAYHVQSLVSLDMPGLAVAHWVLAGAIVGATSNGSTVRVPARRLVGGVLVVAAVLGAFVAVRPLRAELHLAAALRADAHDRSAASVAHLEDATRLAPWASVYHSFLSVRVPAGRAYREAARAAELAPGDPFLAAAAADAAPDPVLEERWRVAAERRDPCNPVWRARS